MKIIISILLSVAAARAYDDIDNSYHATVLADNKLLEKLFGCLVDVNPCDEFGARVKGHMIEIITDGCRECNLTQKHVSHTYIKKLINDFPELYEKFEVKYDSSRKLLQRLDAESIKF